MEGADHDDHHQSTSAENQEEEMVEMASSEEPPRSYDCTFCKRGFSNAQALGGHMNIHRKDKAKLKQQAAAAAAASSNNTTATTDHHHQNQNQQSSFEVSRIGQSYSLPIPTTRSFPSLVLQVPPSMEGVKAKRAWNILGDQESDHVDATKTNKTSHVAVAEVKQLPLFVETPLMISGDHEDDHRQHHQNPSGSQVNERVSSSSSSGSLSEVDLELRLGPEPQEPSSATGTKKFF